MSKKCPPQIADFREVIEAKLKEAEGEAAQANEWPGVPSPQEGRMEGALYPPDEKGRRRKADKVCSGFLSMDEERRRLLTLLASKEAISIFACSRPFRFTRRFTYDGRPISMLDVENVPRVYFSGPVPQDEGPEPAQPYLTWRYDYEQRVGVGQGARHLDETHRLIHSMTTSQQIIVDMVWDAMKKDPKFKHLTNDKRNKPNHITFQPYLMGDEIGRHTDVRFKCTSAGKGSSWTRHKLNSMKEDSPVIVLTVGDDRLVQFRWQYYDPSTEKVTDGKLASVPESGEPCHTARHQHGSVFVGDPIDEQLKQRRVSLWPAYKKRKLNNGEALRIPAAKLTANFTHEVKASKDPLYFSIAIVLRCVKTTTLVDDRTNLAVLEKKTTAGSVKRRQAYVQQGKIDGAPNSEARQRQKARC